MKFKIPSKSESNFEVIYQEVSSNYSIRLHQETKLSGLLAFFCELTAKTQNKYERAEKRLDAVHSDLIAKVKQEKKVTDLIAKGITKKEPEYNEAFEDYLEAKQENDIAKNLFRIILKKLDIIKNMDTTQSRLEYHQSNSQTLEEYAIED